MKNKNFIICLIFFLSILSVEASAKDYHFEKFLKNNISWIKECNEDKIYLKTDMIKIDNGVMKIIDEDNREIILIELFSDEKGVYTSSKSIDSTVYPIVWCRTCQDYRTVNINGNCVVCGNKP